MGNVVLSISKIIFPSAKYLKTINMYLKAFEILLKQYWMGRTGHLYSMECTDTSICHVDKKIDVLGSE